MLGDDNGGGGIILYRVTKATSERMFVWTVSDEMGAAEIMPTPKGE